MKYVVSEKCYYEVGPGALWITCALFNTELCFCPFSERTDKSSARPSLPALTQAFEELSKHFVLVLDEIDLLASKTNSFLYTAFQWPHTMNSKLIIIGIANSIDLTERLLPKLKLGHEPQTLVFTPYSKETIAEILKEKMSADSDDTMDVKAVELCSRKVAAMSGDLRAALHVIKHTRYVRTNVFLISMEHPLGFVLFQVDTDTAKSAIADNGMLAQVAALNL
ncbi:unnamed protein product [Strongylus vulgaris]|uniref:ATPase AAA-type core domain-containing protein n=1 Tax=Strongylus vulgaris TaxID=40348 RepID=A0A3P7IY56_STRVU|nr:unnamed protein product [Strongylus vulgaris]